LSGSSVKVLLVDSNNLNATWGVWLLGVSLWARL